MSGGARLEFVNDQFLTTTSKEFFNTMCGSFLGQGIGRAVFECKWDKTLVVKIAYAFGDYQNVHEYDLWTHANRDLARWLAPCTLISDNGIILLQKRTKPVPDSFKLPRRIPSILDDLKRDNWGLYKGKIVCTDYGRHNAISESAGISKVANWRDARNGHFSKLATHAT